MCMLDWLEALKLAIDASALDAGFHTSGEGGGVSLVQLNE